MSNQWVDSLSCLSVSAIKEVPANIREALTLSPRIKAEALKDWITSSRQRNKRASLFYLSTCHRVELYGFDIDPEDLRRKWAELAGEEATKCFEILRGKECLRHWIRACASLESEVLGETQITGQMKDAFQEARQEGLLSGPLDRFSQRVLASSKFLRSSLPLGEGTVSVAHVAVDGLKDFFDDLSGKSALVVGAGSMAKQSISRLKKLGVEKIYWANRSESKIDQSPLLDERTTKVDFSQIHSHVWNNAISVVATSSHTKIIKEGRLFNTEATLRSSESISTRVILDLGLPRNVEHEIHGKEGFFVRDVDEFSNIAGENSEKRRKYMYLAEKLVEQEILKIEENTRSWSQVPLITELIDLIQERKEDDLQRFKLEKSGNIEYITGNIYSSLLHGILKEAERLDEEASNDFLQNIVRAWRHSGKWRRNQKAELKKVPQKNP
ncbi:glutamyl-tRNA reductase [bacterium]|nr:glutamyl-tRNA reductase [bacterium]